MPKTLLGVLTVLALAALPALAAAPAQVVVTDAWARATPPGSAVGSVYFTARNLGESAVTLKSAASPIASTIGVHETKVMNGLASMHETTLTIPAHASVRLGSAGRHLMLMGLKSPLIAGQMLTLTLDFGTGGRLTVAVPVLDANAQGP